MGIDIYLARVQANELYQQAEELRTAIRRLSEYETSLNSFWRGKEVTPIIRAININRKKLRKVVSDLEALEIDIKKAANEIKREEEERARAEKQRRIRIAAEAYDLAVQKLTSLRLQEERLVAVYMSVPHTPENYAYITQLYNEYQLLAESIREAEEECSLCMENLKAAER